MLQEIKEMIKGADADTLLSSIEMMLLDALEAHQKNRLDAQHAVKVSGGRFYSIYTGSSTLTVSFPLWKYLEAPMSFLQKMAMKAFLGDRLKVIDQIPSAVSELHPGSAFYLTREQVSVNTFDLKITEVQKIAGAKLQRHVDLKYMLFGSEAPPTQQEIAEQTELF